MKHKISSYSSSEDYSSYKEKKGKKGICRSLLIFGGIIGAVLLGGGITAAVLFRNQWLFTSGCPETNNNNTNVKTDDIESVINTTITVTGTTAETINNSTYVKTGDIINIGSVIDTTVIESELFLYLDSLFSAFIFNISCFEILC